MDWYKIECRSKKDRDTILWTRVAEVIQAAKISTGSASIFLPAQKDKELLELYICLDKNARSLIDDLRKTIEDRAILSMPNGKPTVDIALNYSK